jgi:hypothetical protein
MNFSLDKHLEKEAVEGISKLFPNSNSLHSLVLLAAEERRLRRLVLLVLDEREALVADIKAALDCWLHLDAVEDVHGACKESRSQ